MSKKPTEISSTELVLIWEALDALIALVGDSGSDGVKLEALKSLRKKLRGASR